MPMMIRPIIWLTCLIACVCLSPRLWADDALATRWEVKTPHWSWGGLKAGVPAKVVFIVNDRAQREPAELASRFNLDAWVAPIRSSDDYRNAFDEPALKARLDQPVDLIVVAASLPGRDLTPDMQQLIRSKVESGTPLLLVSHQDRMGSAWELWKDLTPTAELKDAMLAALPVPVPPARVGKITLFEAGKGKVVMASMFMHHFTFFDAFQTRYLDAQSYPWALEQGYAIIGWAAWVAMHHPAMPADIAWQVPDSTPTVHERTTLAFTPSPAPQAGDEMAWSLHDAFGQEIAQGRSPLDAQTRSLELTPAMSGQLLLRWRWHRGQDIIGWGVQPLNVRSPLALENLEVASPAGPHQPMTIQWQTTGDSAKSGDALAALVYDPDGRLVRIGSARADAGSLTLEPWRASFTAHQLRLVLERDGKPMQEIHQWIATPLSRDNDLTRFRVILWSNENGRPVERHRYQLMREMGIDTLATVGRRLEPNLMASQAGLRLLPTNVLVPPNRHTNMKAYSAQRDEEALAKLAGQLAPYTPLGYSLADEPSGETNLFDWQAKAVNLVQPQDANVPIGYCGVWLGPTQDVPRFFRETRMAELYSPLHLYTPNLWLGTERDLMRSFVQPGSLLTCWTHYVTSRNHEPYARTVPWLWLLEGMNGISYFCSAYNSFTSLEPTLAPAMDMRWAMQELREIQQGAGDQIIAMKRDTGHVRILFIQDSQDTTPWARALNQLNIPYRHATPESLDDDKDARLILCPSVLSLTDAQLAPLQRAVERGANLLAISPLGVVEGDKPASPDRLAGLFGVKREQAKGDAKAVAQSLSARKGAAVRAKLDIGPWSGAPLSIAGQASGEYQLEPQSGRQVARWTHIGGLPLVDKPALPELMPELAATPAAVAKQHGKAQAILLTFTPELAGIKAMLPALLQMSNAAPAPARVTVEGKPADDIYLYPWRAGDIQLLGIIADYWRIAASEKTEGDASLAYLRHGPQRWKPIQATLTFKQPHHLYDARQGRYLGHADTLTLPITPGQPVLLATLPHTIDALSIQSRAATLRAGQTLQAIVRMTTSAGQATGHKVRVTLTPPAGSPLPVESHTLTLEKGEAAMELELPFNATPGQWRLAVRDFISGREDHAVLQVQPADAPMLASIAPLQMDRARWSLSPADLPEGSWVARTQKDDDTASAATLQVKPLRRSRMHINKDHTGHEYLSGGFTLGNDLIKYTMTYSVCNDEKAHEWEDPRTIWAPYMPGLGINRPQPHIWYYNGYMNVYINGKLATGFRLSDLSAVARQDEAKQADATWDTPYGQLRLSSAMNGSQRGMYQRLAITATEPIREVRVRFLSFPTGFTRNGKEFRTIDPEHQSWVLLGDSVNDRAFFPDARGPGGLLIDPAQWTTADFKSNNFTRTFDGNTSAVTFNWVLWLFPDMTNTQALDYLRLHSHDYQQRLEEMFNPRQPQEQP